MECREKERVRQEMRSQESGTGCHKTNQPRVRPARPGDTERLALLSEQLGYPATLKEVQQRLHRIQKREDHAVYLALIADPSACADGDEGADEHAAAEGCVIGWVHVYVTEFLEADPQAEIGGLIVDERYRGHGAGRLLMEKAEEWARGKGCRAVCLRSNVARKDAHAFYQRIGYTHTKTQHTFRKLF